MSNSERIVSIQALRGTAALLVCIGHAFHEAAAYSTKAASLEQLPWGAGVDIFFLISGFVMMLTTDNTPVGLASAKDFLWRRAIRIVPVYWVFTGLMFISMIVFPSSVTGKDTSWRHLLLSAFFVPHFASDGRAQPLLGLGWTLNLEFMFYVLFAVCMAFRRGGRLPLVFAGLCVVTMAARAGWLWAGADEAYSKSVLLEFALGMALYVFLKHLSSCRPAVRFTWYSFALAGLLMAFLLAWVVGWHSRFYLWGIPAAAFFLSVHLIGASGCLPRGLALAGMLGDSSYALYLSHPFAIEAVKIVGRKAGWWGAGASEVAGWALFCASLLTSLCVGFLVHLLLEKPFLDWIKRLRKRRAQSSTSLQPA